MEWEEYSFLPDSPSYGGLSFSPLAPRAEKERKKASVDLHKNAIPVLENLLRTSSSEQDNRDAISKILTTSKLTRRATERERLVMTLSWYFLTKKEKSKDFTQGFVEKIKSAQKEAHIRHYRASAMMAHYLQLRAATQAVSSLQLDSLVNKFSRLFSRTSQSIRGYFARVEADMQKIMPQIQPEAERFEIAAIQGNDPTLDSYGEDFSERDFARTRHLVTVGFDGANNVTEIVSPNLPDEFRNNPYAVYMRPLPKPQVQTVDLRIDAKPSFIYQILLVDKGGNQMIYGAVDPYAQNSDEMDIKEHARHHKEGFHKLIPLSSGRETSELKAKREKVEELLASWRGYFYPIQYFTSPEDIVTFNRSNLLLVTNQGVMDSYQPQVKIKVDGLSHKLGANHVPGVDEAVVEGYQPTMIQIPFKTLLWEEELKGKQEPYIWARNVTSSLMGQSEAFTISPQLVKVGVPYYLAGQNGMNKYALLALQSQCDIGWGEKVAIELSLTDLPSAQKETELLRALKQQCRSKMDTAKVTGESVPNHYYLVHSDLETTLHEVDPTVFKHVGIHDTDERKGIMSERQGLLDEVEKEKSYFYTTAVLYRYVPEKGILVQDSAGVPAPDIIAKKDQLQAILKVQFGDRIVKEAPVAPKGIKGASDFAGLQAGVAKLHSGAPSARPKIVTGVNIKARQSALQGVFNSSSSGSASGFPPT